MISKMKIEGAKMKTYQQVRREFEQEQTKLFEKYNLFFAFNEKQFKEGAKDEKQIVHIGAGGYLPEKNFEKFMKDYEALYNWLELAVKQTDAEKTILYELLNHEAFYTGDISSALDVLEGFNYTREQVKKVFNKYFEQYA
jgi:hypothetical protein